jgi:ribosomal subunit interface protein
MTIPVQITFRNVEPSVAVEEHIIQQVQKLSQYSHQIRNAKILISLPHHHHRHGNTYHARIDLWVGGEELIVSDHHDSEDLYHTIHLSFKVAARMVRELESRKPIHLSVR